MASTPAIYARLAGSRIRGQAQYRVSFVTGVFANLLVSFMDFLGILVLFHHVRALGGWSLQEVAFLYGSSYLGLRLADLSVGHVEYLGRYIQSGEFDVFLRRPLGSLFQVLSADLSLRQLGGFLQGVAVFVYALATVGIDWTAGRAVMLIVMTVSGFFIFVGIWIATNSIAFWLINTREVANAFTYGGNVVSQYPLHIFAGWLRRLFTVVIPIAFINYFPALYILGRDDPFGSPPILRFISPFVAILTIWVAHFVWGAGARRYQSTGS